jgi:hypothetical protein
MYWSLVIGVDNLSKMLTKHNQFEELNTLLYESFPHIFRESGSGSLIKDLYTIPSPKRSQFIFVLLLKPHLNGYGADKIVGFGMMDCSGKTPIIKNVCRRNCAKGCGKMILWGFEKYAISAGMNLLELHAANEKLAEYYSKMGWRFHKKIYTNRRDGSVESDGYYQMFKELS